MMKKPELLAPAGGMRELVAAVQSGADAVYLGAAEFSARAGASNFSYDELRAAVSYCHVYGVKVHCALNTLIKENEIEPAVAAAKRIYDCGADALIIQDLGLAAHLKKLLPDIELHASTQMTVTSTEGVRYLSEHGFSRVVLARELSMDEIEAIAKSTDTELEVFVHGAICMCYSGQCLMSSILGGRSGNRGRCAQPCRLKYELVRNGAEEACAYALSPKDMALISRLSELKRIGVASLKIEGRLKSAEYVSAVTGIYRKYLDSPGKVSEGDIKELEAAFSRSGFTDGYFTGRLGRAMMAHDNPANNSGSVFTDEAKRRASGIMTRKLPINIFASLSANDVLHVTAYDDDGHCASIDGDIRSEAAKNKPLTCERLCEQLCKLGDTPFSASDINAEVAEGITVPIKEINEARRRMCRELERQRAYRDRKAYREAPIYKGAHKPSDKMYLTAEAETAEQARAVIAAGGIKRLYVKPSVAAELECMTDGPELVTKTADIFVPEEITTDAVSVSSTAAMRYYGDKAKYGDFRLNVYNSLTVHELSGLKCVTLSPELDLREIGEVVKNADTEVEVIGYGYIPLMLMKNCPIKALGKCQRGRREYFLRDRKGIEFPMLCQTDKDGGCRSELLNSRPIYTADIIESIRQTGADSVRLIFTVEDTPKCREIINEYMDALDGKKSTAPEI
ncbi:MAG: U32 family peptidase, partial [Clostridia bacterium]|nr:U32 family peptidase [Clostridia bacterium]